MPFEHTQRWFFRGDDIPARITTLLRPVAANIAIQLTTQQVRKAHLFRLTCPDESAVYKLIDAVGSNFAALAECAFDQECSDDVSAGANVELVVRPDWDGSFDWILEVSFELPHDWPVTLLVARALAEKLVGKHYDELSNEELLAGQTMWMKPPPIVKMSRG